MVYLRVVIRKTKYSEFVFVTNHVHITMVKTKVYFYCYRGGCLLLVVPDIMVCHISYWIMFIIAIIYTTLSCCHECNTNTVTWTHWKLTTSINSQMHSKHVVEFVNAPHPFTWTMGWYLWGLAVTFNIIYGVIKPVD